MALVPAKCSQCGAPLMVDRAKEAAICPHCGTPFVTEKVIQLYSTTNMIDNSIKVEAGGIVAVLSQEKEYVVRAGVLIAYNGESTIVDIPSTVVAIGSKAFQECIGLTSVTIPGYIRSIGENAFAGCTGLKTIKIESKEIEVAEGAFAGCKVTTLFAPAKVAWIIAGQCFVESIILPNASIIEDEAFKGRKRLTHLPIPNGVTRIGKYAFKDCVRLASITIPNSVVKIGYGAFEGCSRLTSIAIPNSITEIGACTFKDCMSLTSIKIPNSITRIGGCTFMGCMGLTSITIPNSVKKIGAHAFYGWGINQTIIFEGSKRLGLVGFDKKWKEGCNAKIVFKG